MVDAVEGADAALRARLHHARERALLEEVADLSSRIRELEAGLGDRANEARSLRQDVTRLRKEHQQAVRRLRRDVAAKRLDRQLRAIPRAFRLRLYRLVKRLKPSPLHVVVVCPVYPGGDRKYGGEFVRARVRLYREAGIVVTVVVVPSGKTRRERYEHEGVTVIRVDPPRLVETIRSKKPDVVAVHHLTPHLWQPVDELADDFPTTVWVHGYEARDWRELAFNYSDEEIERLRPVLDEANRKRRATMSEAFADERFQFVFVSRFMQGVAEEFAGVEAARGCVIPNVIDEELFEYRPRSADHRRAVLWVRTFSAHNYANDLSRDAVLELSRREGFSDLRFTVIGDGRDFEEIVEPLRDLPNVEISQGYVDTAGLLELHATHGIMLVPTRWDSQGLTCGEAMSSGLVPITNRVAAIPEYVPDNAGMVCPPEDPVAIADAIEQLQQDPETYLRMSAAAARTSRELCGREATVGREIELLRRGRRRWWQELGG